ncbi:MAG: hypothetical protein LBH53_03615 [Puniceicoccales bacterium]|jgi:hypothetical protein|nr:hypothetical protein [Puniceicoccales bacterium]
MSRLSFFLLFLTTVLVLAPLAVLRGRVAADCRRTEAVFLSPALAVFLLALWVQIFPAFPKLRPPLAFFAMLLLYGLAPFDGWLRQELLLRIRVWTALRLSMLSPLPWLLPPGRLLEGGGGILLLLLAAFHGIFYLFSLCCVGRWNRWREDLFLAVGGLYLVALYLRSSVLLVLALALQLCLLWNSCGRRTVDDS